MPTPAQIIADELKVKIGQVQAAIQLLDDGATVPFIARYRKEATAGLDDNQLRSLVERLHYLRELNDRRQVILQSIASQDKLTPALTQAIEEADTKARLEDLYLPYRPKRRTKALLAKEAGLEPLAQALHTNPTLEPTKEAEAFICSKAGITDVDMALEGARQILLEQFSEQAELLDELRQYLWQHGQLNAGGTGDKKPNTHKFADYMAYQEDVKKIPSHRALALFRGRREGILRLRITLPEETYGITRMAQFFNVERKGRPADEWLYAIITHAWKIKVFTKLELELMARLRELADEEAIRVFACNLRDLLLAAPAGQQVTMGLDPGIRTGVKVAVVDATGNVLDYTAVFPFAPLNQWHEAIATLAKLAAKHQVRLISLGNGTASRETERLVNEMQSMYPDLQLKKVLVSEAGASVYSASALAAQELPDLDVSIRGAVSIARRLQDPLAELVKIEPKSIGVGQYQHDVNQARLARCLEGVVEDCVNAVGVDVNTASTALLTRVAGFSQSLAQQVVQYRQEHGAFSDRQALKSVARLGEKTFQQAAGFLRINGGTNPLDASAVHPEAYPLVEKIIADNHTTLTTIINNPTWLRQLNANDYVDNQYGLPTVTDVLRELEKPGRDPRPTFKTVSFKEGVECINDVEVGMIMEGVVSNVTNFGAFVDIGVHQDGLVHISALTTKFIKNPHEVIKAGEVVQVRVLEVDKERRRINLTMKLQEEKAREKQTVAKTPKFNNKSSAKVTASKASTNKARARESDKKPTRGVFNTAMADALAKLKQ